MTTSTILRTPYESFHHSFSSYIHNLSHFTNWSSSLLKETSSSTHISISTLEIASQISTLQEYAIAFEKLQDTFIQIMKMTINKEDDNDNDDDNDDDHDDDNDETILDSSFSEEDEDVFEDVIPVYGEEAQVLNMDVLSRIQIALGNDLKVMEEFKTSAREFGSGVLSALLFYNEIQKKMNSDAIEEVWLLCIYCKSGI